MKIRFLVAALFSLFAALAPALEADAIRALAKKPHAREGLQKELEIYPNAREYRMEVVYHAVGEVPHKPSVVTVAEKTVEGKYLVSEFTLPIHEKGSIMVVTFDKKERVYRKWFLMPDDTLAELVGTSVPGSRAVTWSSVKAPEPEQALPAPVLSLEDHTDTQTSWIEIYMMDGKETHRISGVATVTK